MVAHCLYIDGVKSFPINKIVFVRAGCLNPHVGPVDAANYTREPSLVVKPSGLTTCSSAGDGHKMIFFCFWAKASDTSFTTSLRQRILGGRRCHRWVVESCRSQRNPTLQEFVVSATVSLCLSLQMVFKDFCEKFNRISAKSVSTPKFLVWKVVKKNFVLTKHFFAYFWRNYWD